MKNVGVLEANTINKIYKSDNLFLNMLTTLDKFNFSLTDFDLYEDRLKELETVAEAVAQSVAQTKADEAKVAAEFMRLQGLSENAINKYLESRALNSNWLNNFVITTVIDGININLV